MFVRCWVRSTATPSVADATTQSRRFGAPDWRSYAYSSMTDWRASCMFGQRSTGFHYPSRPGAPSRRICARAEPTRRRALFLRLRAPLDSPPAPIPFGAPFVTPLNAVDYRGAHMSCVIHSRPNVRNGASFKEIVRPGQAVLIRRRSTPRLTLSTGRRCSLAAKPNMNARANLRTRVELAIAGSRVCTAHRGAAACGIRVLCRANGSYGPLTTSLPYPGPPRQKERGG